MSAQEFFAKMLPYAKRAGAALMEPVDVILAQWAVESGYGDSRIAQGGNMSGLTHVPNSIDGGNAPYQSKSSGLYFAQYNGNLDLFTEDYIRVMKLSYYDKVRAAVSSEDTIKELALSPFDAGHYGGAGKELLAIINQYGLSKYNAPGTGGTEIKTIPVEVPRGSNQVAVGLAVIAAGVLLISAVSK